MKNSYNPNKLTKEQRHKKKWIPESTYCNRCPFFHQNVQAERKRELCQYADMCDDDCSKCDEPITYCSFLKYISYGQDLFWDGVKICDIRYMD